METPLKILMLEDCESDVGLITMVLKRANVSFESLLVDSKKDFIKALEEYAPHVILSDHSLPQFNSIDAYRVFKDKNLKIPFILVTGTVSEEFAVNCLHQGIDDYILKDNLTRLPLAIESALKKKELELQKLELELNQKAYVEKLSQQNKELIKINKELDRFVYSTSHELKAPLKSILGLINLTQMELIQKKYDSFENYIQLMEKCVGKLGNTLEEVICYSINNRTEINLVPINIAALIEKVWKKLSYMSDINKVETKIKIEQSYPWYSDENRLLIILDNLISNSIRYRNKGIEKSFIIIKAQILAEKVLLTIEDNGIGIPSEYTDKIFDMFYRATTLSDGSGLGLYIVKETLEKLNGRIEVQSEVGGGTIFNIELPNSFS